MSDEVLSQFKPTERKEEKAYTGKLGYIDIDDPGTLHPFPEFIWQHENVSDSEMMNTEYLTLMRSYQWSEEGEYSEIVYIDLHTGEERRALVSWNLSFFGTCDEICTPDYIVCAPTPWGDALPMIGVFRNPPVSEQ